LPNVGYRTFERLRSETFQLHLPDGRRAPMVLMECEPAGPAGSTDSFSLTFHAGPDAPTVQATYVVSAEGLDPQPIFLVPVREVGGNEPRLEYQAVFNRLPGSDPEGGPR
jgi:hypothetical protein